MILLATDYGWRGPWVGQLHATLAAAAPNARVIDLMHDLPAFAPAAAAHLLAALLPGMPAGAVCVGVVDPGVGTNRAAVIVEVDGRWLVGPGNGLFDVLSARAQAPRWWRITRVPAGDSATFDGRDLFAPTAAELVHDERIAGERIDPPHRRDAAADCSEIIYIDGFGNAATGLRATAGSGQRLRVGTRVLERARTFGDGAPEEPMWLVNSLGLVEIVANRASAAELLDLQIGTPVARMH